MQARQQIRVHVQLVTDGQVLTKFVNKYLVIQSTTLMGNKMANANALKISNGTVRLVW